MHPERISKRKIWNRFVRQDATSSCRDSLWRHLSIVLPFFGFHTKFAEGCILYRGPPSSTLPSGRGGRVSSLHLTWHSSLSSHTLHSGNAEPLLHPFKWYTHYLLPTRKSQPFLVYLANCYSTPASSEKPHWLTLVDTGVLPQCSAVHLCGHWMPREMLLSGHLLL